jgi:predicted ATPase
LTFLVGPNGAGKSNFLDALRLITESITASLDHALRDRGGINEVRRRSSGHPTHFGIRLEFQLPDGLAGRYAFRVGAREKGGFEVQEEECRIYGQGFGEESYYRVESGAVKKASQHVMPPASGDRLYLVSAAGLPDFRPLYDALLHMGFYNLNPDEIRDLQTPDPGEVLRRDGGNLASVLGVMAKENEEARKRVVEFLSKVVPGITDVNVKHVGKKETLEFRQQVGSNKSPWRFLAENMSDGTLRALGVLTALFQSTTSSGRRVPLVGIEEPELAVHPGAAGVLRDALKTASASTQVIVTSHSPDLLDDKNVGDDWILSVVNVNGDTKIGSVDEAGRSVIRARLYTAGELLRQGQLTPDVERIESIPSSQLDLFGETDA